MKTERYGYKFTNKNNTRGGIISVILGILAFIAFMAGVIVSYKKAGNAGIIVGALGSTAFLITTVGLVYGLKSFREKDKFYIFSWIGTIFNGILWIAMCLIIAAGFMQW